MEEPYQLFCNCICAFEAFLARSENLTELADDAPISDAVALFIANTDESFADLAGFMHDLISVTGDPYLWVHLFVTNVPVVEAYVLKTFRCTFTLDQCARLMHIIVQSEKHEFLSAYIEACRVGENMRSHATFIRSMLQLAIDCNAIECLRTILKSRVLDLDTEIAVVKLHANNYMNGDTLIDFERRAPLVLMSVERARHEIRSLLLVLGISHQVRFSYTLEMSILDKCLSANKSEIVISTILEYLHFSRRQLSRSIRIARVARSVITAALDAVGGDDHGESNGVFGSYVV